MRKIACIKLFLLGALALLTWSCNDFKDSIPRQFDEGIKNPVGTWKISKATRNRVDITNTMDDFATYRLTFTAEGTYTMNKKFPFLVKTNGSYELNNPQYPFVITFKESSSDQSVAVTYKYSTVAGKREMELTFVIPDGCYRNVYAYTFQKDE